MPSSSSVPTVYYDEESRGSCLFAEAFSKGCGGASRDYRDGLQPGPIALFPSPAMYPLLREAQAAGVDWYYGDHGYCGNLKKHYRITKNNYQWQGYPLDRPTDRWAEFKQRIDPWIRRGSFVLICLNGPHHMRLHGQGELPDWVNMVATELRAHTDREIRVRPKPRGVIAKVLSSMADAVKDCWCVVTYSSNSAVEAMALGVPIITLAPFAASRQMARTSLSDVERPYRPKNRAAFLSSLAENQWNLREIAQGDAWRHLQRG